MPTSFTRRTALGAILLGFSLSASAGDVQEASQLFKQGKHVQALEKVNAVLASDPKDMQARYLKAVIYSKQGRTNDAIALFKSIVGDYPNMPEPYNNLGVIYVSQGLYEKAKFEFETAIRLKPNYAIAHENLGDLMVKMASKSYGHATDADQKNAKIKEKRQQAVELAGGKAAVNGKPASASPSAPATVVAAASTKSAPASAPAPAKPVVVPTSVAKPSAPAPVPARQIPASAPAPVKPAPVPVAPLAKQAPVPAPVASPAKPAATVAAPALVKVAPAVAVKPQATTTPAASKPTASTKAEAGVETAVLSVVEDWARAWSAKDVAKYLAFYGKDFVTPDGDSRADWEASRAKRISKPKSIQVGVIDARVYMHDSTHATVAFKQEYKSDRLSQLSYKILSLSKVGNSWLIQQEGKGIYQPGQEKSAGNEVPVAVEVVKPVSEQAEPAKQIVAKAVPEKVAEVGDDSKGGGSAGGDESAVRAAVQGWARAWSGRDVRKYLAHYSDDFVVPEGSTRADWEAQRQQRIAKVKSIDVQVDRVKVYLVDDTHAVVTLKQAYKSKRTRQITRKTLNMNKVGDVWLIQEELTGTHKPKKVHRGGKTVAKVSVAATAPVMAAPAVVEAAKVEEPAPAAVAASDVQHADEEAVVLEVIQGWARAWSVRDVEEYLGYYSGDFSLPAGVTRVDWEKQRQQRIERAKSIEVKVDWAKVYMTDDNRATVHLKQNYRSDRLRQITRKTLEMVKVGGLWMIQSEQTGYQRPGKSPVAKRTKKAAAEPVQPVVEPAAGTSQRKLWDIDPIAPAASTAAPAADSDVRIVSDEEADVLDALNVWAKAWSAKDATAYLACYAKEFSVPGGGSRTAWEQERRQQIAKAEYIRVRLDDPEIVFADPSHVTVRFVQDYRSNIVRQVNNKSLELVKVDGIWLIRAEKTGVLLPAGKAVAPLEAAFVAAPADKVEAVVPVQTEPASAVAESKSDSSFTKADSRAVLGVVKHWTEAWSARDAEKFLALYAEDFVVPYGGNRAAWQEQRSREVSEQPFNRVLARKIRMTRIDGNHVRASFKLVKMTDRRQEISSKQLVLRRAGAGWLIEKESDGN